MVLVHPYHMKRSKELDDGHPSKSDRKAPKTIAKLVLEGRYVLPYIPQGLYAELPLESTELHAAPFPTNLVTLGVDGISQI